MSLQNIFKFLPEVESPKTRLDFKTKLRWTLITLVTFFVLAEIPLHGLEENALSRFEYLAVILGTRFGSIISLGIGPIVMASIILQLLVGSKILDIDLTTREGKRYFSALQKLLIFFFIIFEAMVYVMMRGLAAKEGFAFLVILQLILGGLIIVFLDELVSKWGFGSGVSLFILAGVSLQLFIRAFGFIGPNATISPVGKFWVLLSSLAGGNGAEALSALLALVVTAAIFIAIVWAQSLKVEIPLSFDRLRGYGIRWPLSFFYTSVIPVILTAALAANIQLFASLLQNWLGHPTLLGGFSENVPISGLAFYIARVNLLDAVIKGSFHAKLLFQALGHILFYVFFATLFAVLWVKTSGMDPASQARNILASGLQIPGFRKDERVLEAILSRYIMPLTVMGGMAIGLIAALTDLLGALVSGTSILLAVMIAYQFYQSIAQQHALDMYPAMKKFMKT